MLLVSLQALTLLLLAVYLGWGIYTLDLRYRRHLESSPLLESVTLIAVLLFYAVEVTLFRQTMRDESIIYMFAVLGLFVSGAALYGHMAVSLTSRLLVDVVTPDSHQDPTQPRLGPAEALERQQDFEGAIQEYLVLARIFPRDGLIARRLGENYVAMKQPREALPWFQRAFDQAGDEEGRLIALNRWIETAQKKLRDTTEAERACLVFLQRYPGSEHATSIRQRLQSIATSDKSTTGHADLELLEAVVESPAATSLPEIPVSPRVPRNEPQIGLDRLSETGVAGTRVNEAAPQTTSPRASSLSLEALSAMPPLEHGTETESAAPPRKLGKSQKSLGLDALNEKPIEER